MDIMGQTIKSDRFLYCSIRVTWSEKTDDIRLGVGGVWVNDHSIFIWGIEKSHVESASSVISGKTDKQSE